MERCRFALQERGRRLHRGCGWVARVFHRYFFRVFFPQAVFHMSTNPVDFLFIAGIYISRNVFYDLCRLGKGFDHLFNALNGMQNSGVVPVIKFPADFF